MTAGVAGLSAARTRGKARVKFEITRRIDTSGLNSYSRPS